MFNPSPMQQPAQRPMPPQAPPQQPAAGGSNFTMNEVPDLTAKLSMLPPNSLQQFAQLHKGDPYIMSLVMSESNRRKKLQQAGQQQQGEPPKVVDQMISSLAPAPQQLPEQQGIAQLPTPNMANMADGGIAGYSDYEENYAAGGVTGYADKGKVEEDLPSGVFKMGDKLMYRDASGKMREYTPEAKKTNLADMLKAVSDFSNRNAGKPPGPPPIPGAPPAPPGAPMPPVFQTANQQGFMPGGSTPPAMGFDNAPPPPPPQQQPPAANLSTPRIPSVSVPLPTAMTPQQSMDTAGQFINQREQEINADLMARKARVQQEGDRNLADYQAGIAALPEAYKGYEERLKKEETGAGKEKEDAQGMAIFKAGLAMMAGSSPNAFENIGKGALAGVEDYQGALKDLKKAARERDKAFADIENARLAYKRDDMKTYQTLKDRGQDRLDRVDDAMGAFSAKVLDTTAGVGANLYSNGIKDKLRAQEFNAQLESNRNIANATNETHMRSARANDPLALYRELGGNPTGAVAKGYGSAKEEALAPSLFAQYDKMAGDQTMVTDPNSKYPTKGAEFVAKYPSVQAYISKFRSSMGQGTMSGTGQGWGTAVEIPPK